MGANQNLNSTGDPDDGATGGGATKQGNAITDAGASGGGMTGEDATEGGGNGTPTNAEIGAEDTEVGGGTDGNGKKFTKPLGGELKKKGCGCKPDGNPQTRWVQIYADLNAMDEKCICGPGAYLFVQVCPGKPNITFPN